MSTSKFICGGTKGGTTGGGGGATPQSSGSPSSLTIEIIDAVTLALAGVTPLPATEFFCALGSR